MAGIIDHRPKRQQMGLKENRQAQRNPKKEVVNSWTL